MSTTRTDQRPAPSTPPPASLSLGSRSLPRWAGRAVPAAVVVAAVLALATGASVGFWSVAVAVLATAALYVASRVVEGGRKAVDRLVTTAVASAFVVAMLPLVSLTWTVVSNGARRFDTTFFTNSMLGVVDAGGGAYHALLGTLIVTALATVISVPIGLLTGIYLVEYGHGRLKAAITFLVDVMTGIPSIVAGLFAVALFTLIFGPGVRLGIMGAIALSVLMIPLVVRSTEEMLKLVPNELREAAYALGVPKWLTVVKVVLRTAVGGIATGITLAIARVIGETAPLLLTTGLTTGTNLNPFDGRMATLPVFAWYQYTQPGVPPEAGIDRAWTAALVLIILVMAFNLLARVISRVFAPKAR